MGLLGQAWNGLTDLVLPGTCAGCGAGVPGSLCPNCVAVLDGLRPHPVRPTPAPAGLPSCIALGAYDGVLREVLLAYKERGRHVLARPLGDWLAAVVALGVRQAGYPAETPVLLVPVPDTAAAARDRYGDHMRRLARRAVVVLVDWRMIVVGVVPVVVRVFLRGVIVGPVVSHFSASSQCS